MFYAVFIQIEAQVSISYRDIDPEKVSGDTFP